MTLRGAIAGFNHIMNADSARLTLAILARSGRAFVGPALRVPRRPERPQARAPSFQFRNLGLQAQAP
eukprot:15003374-Alexandrium_andersonii.AAC.1